jgi:hypothetical protein
MNPKRDLRTVCIVALALVALTLKLAIAYNTIGTNDAITFYGFAKVLSQHGLEFTYQHSRYFNHPPLTAYYLRGILALTEQPWCQAAGIYFPFLLRLPGIVADFLVVLVLLKMANGCAYSNLGVGPFRRQPGFIDGLRISRKHRSGNGVVSCLRWVYVPARKSRAVRIIFRAQLSDQSDPPFNVARLLFLLDRTRDWSAIQRHLRNMLRCALGSAHFSIPDPVCQERFVIRKLLGRMGDHLLPSPHALAALQCQGSFRFAGACRRYCTTTQSHNCCCCVCNRFSSPELEWSWLD